ncbi:hypothetical protein HDU91_003125, partial [Kappamyces sp. JEL0680]
MSETAGPTNAQLLFTPHNPRREGRVAISGSSHSIHYAVFGSGPVRLCLVQGLMSSMGAFRELVDVLLMSSNPQYSLLVLDNRGIGLSSRGNPEDGDWSMAGMGRDVVQVLDHVGWQHARSVHLVGISM